MKNLGKTKSLSVSWCKTPVEIPGLQKKYWHQEKGMQIYCMTWLRKQLLITGDPKYDFWHHSPNEGRRSPGMGLTLKLMGMSKGYPDLVQHGLRLALELKPPGGLVSKDQWRWLAYFKAIGYHAEVVRSFERFKELVESA